MRLFDRVVRSPRELLARDPAGMRHRLPGVGIDAEAIQDCGLRYILDQETSRQCLGLVRRDVGLLLPSNPLLRLPAERFWIEWTGDPAPGSSFVPIMGALVDASPDGRSGRIAGFWEDENGQPGRCVAGIEFDLDRPLHAPTGCRTTLQLKHGELHHLNDMFRHMLLHLDPAWTAFMMKAQGAQEAYVRTLAEAAWHNLPFVLTFSALLNNRNVLDERPSEFAKLNRARSRRGRAPMLDHIEVRMTLGAEARSGAGQGAGLAARRLHHVRGHLVHRMGSIFWRTSHLRGDRSVSMARKTIRVGCAAPGGERKRAG